MLPAHPKANKLTNDFLHAHDLEVTGVAGRQSTKHGWTQDITVKDDENIEHYFYLAMDGPKIKFLCESYESDDKSKWGLITWAD